VAQKNGDVPRLRPDYAPITREQVAAVRSALAHQPLPAEAIAARFKRTPRAGVQAVLEALEELGMVAHEDGAYRLQG